MVAAFVVALVLLFLLIGALVVRLGRSEPEREALWIPAEHPWKIPAPPLSRAAGQEEFPFPPGLFLSPGHLWMHLRPSGKVKVGVDDFSQRVLGRIDRVEVPPVGTRVEEGDDLFRLRQGRKSVTYASPLAGTVAARNPFAQRNPRTVKRDPYGEGWIVALSPSDPEPAVRGSRLGERARNWLREEAARFREFLVALAPADEILGRTAADGGLLVDRSLESMGPAAWVRFQEEFLAAPLKPEAATRSGRAER